jgi:hypothetical protein
MQALFHSPLDDDAETPHHSRLARVDDVHA